MDKSRRFFGDFELDPQTFRLLKSGTAVPVEPKALDLLRLLVDRAPRVVEKTEIFSEIWRDVSVSDNALTRLIAQLRRALDDDSRAPRYIETVATRGYRFVADVRLVPPVTEAVAGSKRAQPAADAGNVGRVLPDPPGPSRSLTLIGSLFVVALVAAALLVYALTRESTPVPVRSTPVPVRSAPDGLDPATLAALKPMQLTSSSGLDAFPALSPDGHSVAFSSDRGGTLEIYIQGLTPGATPLALTTDGRQSVQPAWSPDGQFIAYHTMGTDGIWIVPSRGGTARQLSDFGANPVWSPDGTRLAFQSLPLTDLSPSYGAPGSASTIWTIGAGGGRPEQLSELEQPAGAHLAPVWSPDGRRVFFTAGGKAGSRVGVQSIWSIDVDSRKTARIATHAQLPREIAISAAGDYLYFSSRDTGVPWRLKLPTSSSDAAASPEPMGLPISGPGARHFRISADGRRFVWTAMDVTSNLWSIAVDPQTGRARSDSVALTDDSGPRATLPTITGNGRVAFVGTRSGLGSHIWVTAPGQRPRQLTIVPERNELVPTWTADGGEIAFLATQQGRTTFYVINPETGRERPLFGPVESWLPPGASIFGGHALSPDLRRFAVGLLSDAVANIWIGAGDGTSMGALRQLTFEKEGGSYPTISPDGRFVAYQCAEGTSTEVCVVPAEGGTPTRLTSGRGQNWVSGWGPDNDRIVYAERRQGVWNIAWASRTTRLMQTVTRFSSPRLYVRYPAWSPAGNTIVFERAEVKGRIWSVELPAK